jgi:hypothetical protein
MTAPAFAKLILGWKPSPRKSGVVKNKAGWQWVPNVADVDNLESLTLGAAMLTALGQTDPNVTTGTVPASLPQQPGTHLENHVRDCLKADLPLLDTSRAWDVHRGRLITHFAQYQHLTALDTLILQYPNLRVSVGRDYLIKPDVTVGLKANRAINGFPFLHAAVSCKWTIRSDRVQNVRHEFNQMIRHRRGRQPHLVTVTAEPLPSRLASIARGTGEVDATYHIAFDELAAAVAASKNAGQQQAWNEVVGQGRLKNFNDLANDLIIW